MSGITDETLEMLDIEDQTSASCREDEEPRPRDRPSPIRVQSYLEQVEMEQNVFEFPEYPIDIDEIMMKIPENENEEATDNEEDSSSSALETVFPGPDLTSAVHNTSDAPAPGGLDFKARRIRLVRPGEFLNVLDHFETGKEWFHELHTHKQRKRQGNIVGDLNAEGESLAEEELTPEDSLDVTANDLDDLYAEMKTELSRTDKPHLDFIAFLEKKYESMKRFVRLYKSQSYSMKLLPIDAEKHWSKERLSREDHDDRITRWDVAMAEALADDMKEELEVIQEGGFIGIRGDEATYFENMAKSFEHRVNRPLEYMDYPENKFYYHRFALTDVLEKKEINGVFFRKALSRLFTGSKKEGFLIGPQKWRNVKVILTKHGLQWDPLYADMQEIVKNNLTLPKGRLYCQLLLNIASLVYYDLKNNTWWCEKLVGPDLEKRLFHGIPFDYQGNPFTFEVNTVAEEPVVEQ